MKVKSPRRELNLLKQFMLCIFQKIQNIYFTFFYKFENSFAKCEMWSANSNPVYRAIFKSALVYLYMCFCLSGSNYHNLHWKLYFSKIYSTYNFKIFCPSGLTIVALHVTLRQFFFLIFFHDTMQNNK